MKMQWIKVIDELPRHEAIVDIWVGERIPDVVYDSIEELFTDMFGSYWELGEVTHWRRGDDAPEEE